MQTKHGIWKYEARLPAITRANQVTLGEGRTPLIRSERIGPEIGLDYLYFKLESLNPTGSYKDRISALGVSLAKENGRTACIGTTSGNAGSSIAAYAARAGIAYHVYVQENIVASKLEQVKIHGANIIRVKQFGMRDDVGHRVFDYVKEQAKQQDWELLITAYAHAPLAMEAVKTISYELHEDVPQADAVFAPVGGGGLLTGIFRGYSDLVQTHQIPKPPQMVACQSAGCANVAKAWQLGRHTPLPGPSTSAISGIQVPNSPDGKLVLDSLHESQGFAEILEDEETWHWQEKMVQLEGIFCEPAGAIALAGAAQAVKEGRISKHARVVCIVSGAGYKDAERMRGMAEAAPPIPLIALDSDRH